MTETPNNSNGFLARVLALPLAVRGALGCFAMIIAVCGGLAVIGAIAGPNKREQPAPVRVEERAPAVAQAPSLAPPTQTPAPTPAPTPATRAAKIGERFALGDYAYTIISRTATPLLGQKLGNQIIGEQAEEGATFIVIAYKIENLGKKSAIVSAGDFKLADASGREFTASARGTTGLAMSPQYQGKIDLGISQLQPGVPRNTAIAFEVPADVPRAAGLRLIVPEKSLMGLFGAASVEVPLN